MTKDAIANMYESMFKHVLSSVAGRRSLAQCMVAPLRTGLDYSSIARKVLTMTTVCDECGVEYDTLEEHPDNGCGYGMVSNIIDA